jgi:hypothetical protein
VPLDLFASGEMNVIEANTLNKSGAAIENDAFLRREEEFASRHRNDSDEELLKYLRRCASELGRIPYKREVVGFTYLKSRFGPWPRVLEKAGLKEPRKKKLRRRSKAF